MELFWNHYFLTLKMAMYEAKLCYYDGQFFHWAGQQYAGSVRQSSESGVYQSGPCNVHFTPSGFSVLCSSGEGHAGG
jgi:hypothetical protein